MDRGISCFQHCNSKIFYFDFPESCPECYKSLKNENFIILPFRVPYPFVKALQYSCSVVIKPTRGNFLDDYCNSSDLHIGLTLSSGIVTEYDSRGLISNDTNSWDQCLIVFEAEESWHEYWDDLLKSVSKDDWVREKYQEESFNCYTFVLKFLKRLGHKKLSEYVDDKNEFSKYVLLPKTTNAAKYISIYRELKNSNYYICK